MNPPMPSSSIGNQAVMQGHLSHDLSFLLPSNLTYSEPITDSAPTTPADSAEAAPTKVTATSLPPPSSYTGNLALAASSLSKDLSFLAPNNPRYSKPVIDSAPSAAAKSPIALPSKTTASTPYLSSKTSAPALAQSWLSKDLSFLLPKTYPDPSTDYALATSGESSQTLLATSTTTSAPTFPQSDLAQPPLHIAESHDLSFLLPSNQLDHDNNHFLRSWEDPSNALFMGTTGSPMQCSPEPALQQASAPDDSSFLLRSTPRNDNASHSFEVQSVLPPTMDLTDTLLASSLTPDLDVSASLLFDSHPLSFPLQETHNNPIADPSPPTPAAPSNPLSFKPKPPSKVTPSTAARTSFHTPAFRTTQNEEHATYAGSDICDSETETETHNTYNPQTDNNTNTYGFSFPSAKRRRSTNATAKFQLDEADMMTPLPSAMQRPKKYLGIFGKLWFSAAMGSESGEWDGDGCGDGDGDLDTSEALMSQEEGFWVDSRGRDGEERVSKRGLGRDRDKRTRSSLERLVVRASDGDGRRKAMEVEDDGAVVSRGQEGSAKERPEAVLPAGMEEGPMRIVSHVLIPARSDI